VDLSREVDVPAHRGDYRQLATDALPTCFWV
jgi:hypothetical protein